MTILRFFLLLLLALPLVQVYGQNNPPIANLDTASTSSGVSINIFVRNNDFDSDGNNLSIDTVFYNPLRSETYNIGGIFIRYVPLTNYSGIDTLYYVLCDDGVPSLCDTGMVIIDVAYMMYEAFENLDINNVNALFNASYNHFLNPQTYGPGFEVPKGSGKHTLFSVGLVIGAQDAFGNIFSAVTGYNSSSEFSAGPIMDSNEFSFSQDSLWNRLWKINKSTIDFHKVNWSSPGYTPPDILLSWPAHGNAGLGQAYQLAPFFDRNNDNYYDPYDGDYPKIRGDQAIYFIRNDARAQHQLSNGDPMNIEVHGMAYAYNCTQDSALDFTIFVNYRIINRSVTDYYNAYVGFLFDPDIGDPFDDYIASDVGRGSAYGYNGPNIGRAQSLVVLKGPSLPPDGIDNPSGDCAESLNGFGFGDQIVDNEAMGMTSFMYYCANGIPGCSGEPSNPFEYYGILRAVWKDSSHVKYGGWGHTNNCTSCEDSNFMWPRTSDSCNWGTSGVIPADTLIWGEGINGNFANDRRGSIGMGPFDLTAYDTVEFDIAYVFGLDYQDTMAQSSIDVMNMRIDSVRSYFNSNQTPCGEFFLGEDEMHGPREYLEFSIHPNPATSFISLENLPADIEKRYQVYDVRGQLVLHGSFDNTMSVNINNLSSGVFFITLHTENNVIRAKFIKL